MTSTPPSGMDGKINTSFRSLAANPWFYALISCFLLLVLLACRLITDYDLGFHLKGGQWIIENGSFPAQDTFTYTVNDRDYVDLHWLYQVMLYGLYFLGGYSLISVANIVLIALAFLVTFLRMRLAGAPLWMSAVLLAAALLASEIRFQPRPEMLSWVYLGLTLWILELRISREKNLLILLPLIMLAWVNTQGLFAAGWAVMAFYLASGWFHAGRLDRGLLKYSGLAFAACLLNPYFLKGVVFPFTLLAVIGGSNDFKRAIGEFQSPWIPDREFFFNPDWAFASYKIFCLLLLLLLLATLRKRKIHEFLLAGSFFYLSFTSLRNIPLFMLACVPLAAQCWKEMEWGRLKKILNVFFSKPLAAWIFTALVLGLGLRVMTDAYYVSDRRYDRFGWGLDAEQQPVRAAEFLVQNRLDGRILNHLNCGGWLDWKGPQKTFIDGRLEVMGEKFFTEFNDSQKPGGLEVLTAIHQPDILAFNPDSAPPWLVELGKTKEWRPVYLDESSVIYLKKGYAPEVPELDAALVLAQRGISPDIRGEAGTLIQTPRTPAWKGLAEGFYRSERYSLGLKTIGAYFMNTGKFDAAEAVFLENIRRSQGRYYDLFIGLASLYNRTGRMPEAQMCLKRIFQDVPRESVEKPKKRVRRR